MKRIRLTESDLRNIVSKSVKRILKEDDRLGWSDDTYSMLEELKEIFSGNERELIDRICGRIDEHQLSEILYGLLEEYNQYDEE